MRAVGGKDHGTSLWIPAWSQRTANFIVAFTGHEVVSFEDGLSQTHGMFRSMVDAQGGSQEVWTEETQRANAVRMGELLVDAQVLHLADIASVTAL